MSLKATRYREPGMFNMCWEANWNTNMLIYNDKQVGFFTGIRQEDPFGPALFSLGIDKVSCKVTSVFHVWYMDDATLCGVPEQVT